MPSRKASDAARIELERQQLKAQLATAIDEEDDPLAAYDRFVQWTLGNYSKNDPNSGLLELLERATGEFKEDPVYKTDLRYLKLWSLYAGMVERSDAIAIYAYLLANEIGTLYSILYEGYATLLEEDGRWPDAEAIYHQGIKCQARPVERLKNRYREFQNRSPSSSTSPSLSSSASIKTVNPTDGLRRNALKNQSRSASASTPTPTLTTATSANLISINSSPASRYAHMLAPPAPGKRPEKLRFNLSLLFTDEGVEYSIQEARARSIGLLGKKWGPPPESQSSSLRSSVASLSMPVDFNEDGQKSTRIGAGRKSFMGGAEPTMTINTKEALADVFGMYNSPEKNTRRFALPGSKHAPLKKVESMTPSISSRLAPSHENESGSQNTKTPTPAFRPFVDENLQSNRMTPGVAKFTPFVDAGSNNISATTPRPVLSLKDPSVSVPNSQLNENPPRSNINVTKLKSPLEDSNSENVFSSKVFTPAQAKPLPLAPFRDVFTDDHGKPQPKPKSTHTHERAKSHHDISSSRVEEVARPPAFTPFIDENAKTPFKVFSRPPDQTENAFTPKTPSVFSDSKPAFTPFRDHAAFTPLVDKESQLPMPLQERPVLSKEVVEIEDSVDSERDSDQSQDGYNDEEEEYEQYETSIATDEIEPEYEDREPYQEVPLGGRFGQINVMTPIIERTCEFTTSTRGTPSERLRSIAEDGRRTPIYENVFIQQHDEQNAIIAAERLAAEVREDGSEEDEEPLEPFCLAAGLVPPRDSSPVALIEEKAGMLSLNDTLTLSSRFKPPNPCNPFDPLIITTLLSGMPTDPHYHDLRQRESNKLDELQRFAKKARKTSGNLGNGHTSDIVSCFSLELDGHRFSVSEKLGEGGFGAVFKARDLGTRQEGEDSDDDFDDDDEDGSSMFAIKVVRPRNRWEYHVLRRLHLILPASLRRSIILPHALYMFCDESFLVLDLCTQGTLLDVVNNAVAAGISQQGACLDELLVAFFTIELLRLIESIHNAGFIHGDLKIDNCLLRLEDIPSGGVAWSNIYQPSGEGGWKYKGLKLIDFGRTIDTRLFPPGQQYIAEWPTDDRDCLEVREGRPWTYQADYFGLAGIIYCMLFGKYIQGSSVVTVTSDGSARYKISTPLKRYWQTDWWNRLFDVLLNPCLARHNGQLPVSEQLESLRGEMESWLQANCNRTSNTLKGLLKKVEVSCLIR